MPPEVGREQEQIDAKIELMRELPRRQVTNIVAAVHAGPWCNRTATDTLAISDGFQRRRFKGNEESDTGSIRINRKFCVYGFVNNTKNNTVFSS